MTKLIGKVVYFIVIFFVILAGFIMARSYYVAEKNISIEVGVEGRVTDAMEVTKGDAIVIRFSSPVLKESVDGNFVFNGDLKFKKEWKNDSYLRIEIEEYPKPNEDYQITIDKIRSKRYIPINSQVNVGFSGVKPPNSGKVFPADGTEQVDYNENIEIDLDSPMGKEYYLELKSEPPIKFDYTITDDRSKIKILPLEPLRKETEYKIEITIRHQYYKDFKKIIHTGSFVTKRPPEIVYSIDRNGQPLRTQPRIEDITPVKKEGKSIDIDLSSQTLFLFENGKELGAFRVSSGKRGMDTPTGEFAVMGRAARPWSQEYKLYMPWFIQFTNQGHGIHELPEWPGGAKEGANHLGIPVSHGCVRLGVGVAKIVYDFAELGVPIIIHQ